METAKHTPGPWKYESMLGSKYRFVIMDEEGSCYLADVYWGGGMNHKTTPQGTPEANARLMAAAPELLEAALAVVDAYGCECVDQGHPSHCPMCVLRKAITKAVGIE